MSKAGGKVAVIAPGQGSQHPGGVADLPAEARPWFERASELVGVDLWQAGLEWEQEALGRPSVLQPFLVAWGMADYARREDRLPPIDFALGHSSGENTAMVLSGALDFDDGVRFARERGLHLDGGCDLAPGRLVALAGVTEEQAHAMAAATGLEIANYNAPDQFVLGGGAAAAEKALVWAAAQDVAVVVLRVNGAFHTALFQEADARSEALIAALPLRDTFTPLIGNASGQVIRTPAEMRAELSQQYTRPIRWVSALETAYDAGVRTFAVTGPGNAMAGLVRRFGKSTPERLRVVRLNAPEMP